VIFFTVRRITPPPHQNYSILHYRVKIGKITCFERASVADVNHRPNYITCCTLGVIWSVLFFNFRWLSVCKPRNILFTDFSVYFPS
jgi:hypothetical protein